jgi:hypothetical protein
VLFVSRYPLDVLVEKGVLQYDDPFLGRPFTSRGLLEQVEQSLAASARNLSVMAGGA